MGGGKEEGDVPSSSVGEGGFVAADGFVADGVREAWVPGLPCQSPRQSCPLASTIRPSTGKTRHMFTPIKHMKRTTRTEIRQLGSGVQARRPLLRIRQQHILRLQVPMDNLLPALRPHGPVIPPQRAVAERIGDAIEDMPHERFGEDETGGNEFLSSKHEMGMQVGRA